MKCENIRDLMSAYIDNEINEVDKAKLEKHIAQCPQCKEEYELLKDLVLECSDIDEVELPEDFREELHSKLLEAKAAKPSKLAVFMKKNRWMSVAGTAAAVLVVALALNNISAPKTADQAALEPGSYGTPGAYSDQAGNGAKAKDQIGMFTAPEAAPAPTEMAKIQDVDKSKTSVQFSESVKAEGSARGQNNYLMTTTTAAPQQTRKIIKNGNLSLKVADVDSRLQEIRTLAQQKGGYEESSYVDNVAQPQPYTDITKEKEAVRETTTKIANMTIKVPAEHFESVYQSITAMGKLVNQSTNSSDITSQYQDIEARVANLKVQEKHLQEIMGKASTVEDIMKVEAELNRVRTEIDRMTGDLKNWDSLVEYSTIYINMTEVKEAELERVDVPGVWQKAQQGFVKTINNLQKAMESLFVFLVSALPYIVIVGAGSLLAYFWIKRKKS